MPELSQQTFWLTFDLMYPQEEEGSMALVVNPPHPHLDLVNSQSLLFHFLLVAPD